MNQFSRTLNHVVSYAYGEPYEGKPVDRPLSFDLSDADVEVIRKALECQSDLETVIEDVSEMGKYEMLSRDLVLRLLYSVYAGRVPDEYKEE